MKWVADYIGIPYIPHGRDRNGLDCWGLVMLVYREQLQIELSGLMSGDNAYSFATERRVSIKSINNAFTDEQKKWHKIDKPLCFDAAVFTLYGLVYHAGIVLDDKMMLHSENKAGAVVELWNRKDLYGFYRFS